LDADLYVMLILHMNLHMYVKICI